MAETCYLKDGRVEVVLESLDVFLERLIREELGDDAARLFNLYVEETEAEVKAVTDSLSENERSADGYYQMCHDACDSFREVLDLLDAPRLRRKDLRAVAQEGYDNLYKNL